MGAARAIVSGVASALLAVQSAFAEPRTSSIGTSQDGSPLTLYALGEGPKRVLILGGGFAGVYTARLLERVLKPHEAEITLVNRENYWVYQPMLPEVISGSIGLTDVVSPIRRLCPRTRLVMREVEAIVPSILPMKESTTSKAEISIKTARA